MPSVIQGVQTLSTTEVGHKLGFIVTVALLKSCGLHPVYEHPNRCYWRESDFPLICTAIKGHLDGLLGQPGEQA